ncbi:MAG TPA: nitronate monooxygenase [Steroidobacteraceae bacterium]|jgi:nitronate monooxygenase|nr:nitronate monooxygenase [Steroidobacteraceae bacterium]
MQHLRDARMGSEPLRRAGIARPIFQAPMGSLASPELAAAVSNAGAVGHLACTWRTPAGLAEAIRATRALTDKPFGANFVLDFPIEEQLSLALELRVPVISFFWGTGARYVERVKSSGALAIQVIGSVAEALAAAAAGFDLLVAQGRDAGGHVCSQLGLMALLPQVVDAVAPTPVLAAGGIADRRGVAAALALGARGVWVGTRFLAALEANIHPIYRERVLAANADDTLYSQVFDRGWPEAALRALRNSTTRAWERAGRPPPGSRPGEDDILGHYADGTPIPRYSSGSPTREVSGEIEAMVQYAGGAVGLVRRCEPAAAIVEDLAAGLGLEAHNRNLPT